MKYIYYKRIGKSEDEVQEALEKAFQDYASRWNSGGSAALDQAVGRLLLLCFIQKKDWDSAAIHLKSLTRRFPDDPNFLKLMKTLYWQKSSDPAQALQMLFDSSNSSPLFQPEDSPMQDIEGTLDNALESK